MLRITGGIYKGRVLKSPAGQAIRPTTGRVRESVFSRFKAQMIGAQMLDLFAGSGLMGFEALSRGAQSVVAVEKVPAHARLIQANAASLGLTLPQHTVVVADALKWLAQTNPSSPFNLVYADPPYEAVDLERLLALLFQPGWLSAQALVLLEHGPKQSPPLAPEGWHQHSYLYGDTVVSAYQKNEA